MRSRRALKALLTPVCPNVNVYRKLLATLTGSSPAGTSQAILLLRLRLQSRMTLKTSCLALDSVF